MYMQMLPEHNKMTAVIKYFHHKHHIRFQINYNATTRCVD